MRLEEAVRGFLCFPANDHEKVLIDEVHGSEKRRNESAKDNENRTLKGKRAGDRDGFSFQENVVVWSRRMREENGKSKRCTRRKRCVLKGTKRISKKSDCGRRRKG